MKRSSWGKLFRELAKCIVICANCHLKVHARIRRGEPDGLDGLEQLGPDFTMLETLSIGGSK